MLNYVWNYSRRMHVEKKKGRRGRKKVSAISLNVNWP